MELPYIIVGLGLTMKVLEKHSLLKEQVKNSSLKALEKHFLLMETHFLLNQD
jgi:hypothetical protein